MMFNRDGTMNFSSEFGITTCLHTRRTAGKKTSQAQNNTHKNRILDTLDTLAPYGPNYPRFPQLCPFGGSRTFYPRNGTTASAP